MTKVESQVSLPHKFPLVLFYQNLNHNETLKHLKLSLNGIVMFDVASSMSLVVQCSTTKTSITQSLTFTVMDNLWPKYS